MRNIQKWKPSKLKFDNASNSFVPNLAAVYAGSVHVFGIQQKAYHPIFTQYCKGKLLDCGCGKVPYFEKLRDQVSNYYCVDWSENPDILDLLDEKIDLSKQFQLAETDFDCVLLSDVLAHIKYPAQLIKVLAGHLKSNGVLVITTPFVYWISEYPHEYFHPTEFALRSMCEDAQLEVIHLEPYGGYPDVLLDTLNKGMTSPFSNRIFRLLASVVKKTSRYKRSNEKTRYSYPIGYTLVARKK